MTPRILLAVTARVLTQLRRDRRTVAMLLVLPCVLITLLWWMFLDQPGDLFDRFGPGLLAIFPFIVMFLVTSVTTLRERSSGTLERLLAMPMGKLDFLGGYALAFGAVATVQAALVVALSVGPLGLDVAGPVWLLGLVAVADAVLGTALGLLRERLRADGVPGRAVHAAVRDPADPAVRALRAARRDARGAAARSATCSRCPTRPTRCRVSSTALRPPRSGATSASSRPSPWPRWRSAPPRSVGVRRSTPRPRGRDPRSSLVGMSLLRQPLLLLARSEQVKNLVTRMPVSAGIVRSYVPGEAAANAVDATARLVGDDLRVTPRLPRRGHPRRRPGRRDRARLPRPPRPRSPRAGSPATPRSR